MADIEEFLESLNNKELRAKCIEYNLPNVPVTNTSRSILIHRLKEAITGVKDAKKKPKKQRETVHEVTATIVLDDDDEFSFVQPQSLNQTFPKTSASKTQSSRKLQMKEDDSDTVPNDATSNVKRKTTGGIISTKILPEVNYPYDLRSSPANSSRNSSIATDSESKRSVTLSRSGISTTSYSVHIERQPTEIIDESEEEEMILDEGEFEIDNSQTTNNNNYEYNKENPASYKLNFSKNLGQSSKSCLKKNNLKQMNIPPNAPQVSFYEPEQGKITYQSSSSNLSYTRPSIESHNAHGNEDSFSFRKGTIIHKVEVEKPSLYPFQMLNTAAESMSSSMDSAYVPSTAGSFLKMSQRKSTSNVSSLPYQRTTLNKGSSYKSSYGYHDEDENVTGSGSSNSESEYDDSSVSNEEKLKTKDFSRTLKPHSTPNSTYRRSPLARRSLRPEDSTSIMTNFKRFLITLDERYKIFTFIGWSALFTIIIFFVALFFL